MGMNEHTDKRSTRFELETEQSKLNLKEKLYIFQQDRCIFIMVFSLDKPYTQNFRVCFSFNLHIFLQLSQQNAYPPEMPPSIHNENN